MGKSWKVKKKTDQKIKMYCRKEKMKNYGGKNDQKQNRKRNNLCLIKNFKEH
jgi:hypothetical protein